MSDYRTIGGGSSYVLVELEGEKVFLSRSSNEYDEHLEQGIQALMTCEPSSTYPIPIKPTVPAANVTERRVTLQTTAKWAGRMRTVRQIELCETVTTEVFE